MTEEQELRRECLKVAMKFSPQYPFGLAYEILEFVKTGKLPPTEKEFVVKFIVDKSETGI